MALGFKFKGLAALGPNVEGQVLGFRFGFKVGGEGGKQLATGSLSLYVGLRATTNTASNDWPLLGFLGERTVQHTLGATQIYERPKHLAFG